MDTEDWRVYWLRLLEDFRACDDGKEAVANHLWQSNVSELLPLFHAALLESSKKEIFEVFAYTMKD